MTTGAKRGAKLQSNLHHQRTSTQLFLQAACPSCRPINSVRVEGLSDWSSTRLIWNCLKGWSWWLCNKSDGLDDAQPKPQKNTRNCSRQIMKKYTCYSHWRRRRRLDGKTQLDWVGSSEAGSMPLSRSRRSTGFEGLAPAYVHHITITTTLSLCLTDL